MKICILIFFLKMKSLYQFSFCLFNTCLFSIFSSFEEKRNFQNFDYGHVENLFNVRIFNDIRVMDTKDSEECGGGGKGEEEIRDTDQRG